MQGVKIAELRRWSSRSCLEHLLINIAHSETLRNMNPHYRAKTYCARVVFPDPAIPYMPITEKHLLVLELGSESLDELDIYLLSETVIIGDVQDVFGIVEGGPEPICPQLDVSPLVWRDPVRTLQHKGQLREEPDLQISQLLGYVEAEESAAVSEKPGSDGRCDPAQRGHNPPNRSNLRHGRELGPAYLPPREGYNVFQVGH
ncbi:hypothetical protein EJB05_47019 [Eragrostis curvula]|uniref:Uncharacterized protein n=1 Tax=Eragrostis curvula TaxID=38414 RepID=A0A5J9T8T2_9POAL|nr:hypothetical protein EJB05_47019 [Eragrostis curvula]